MQQILLAQARGDEPRGFSSGRTLFGIKSHTDEVIERVVAEEDARCRELMEKRDRDEAED